MDCSIWPEMEEGIELHQNLILEKEGKQVRMGYTTGSCAAGAAKAAAKMLITGEVVKEIEIDTPAGIPLCLSVEKAERGTDFARCCIVKDGGDDPDVTTGLEIFAEARFSDREGILISTGEGIGIVTKRGLKVEVGQPAINPEPRKMILKEVSEIQSDGISLFFSVPKGRECAEKTLNARLGIEGGISILGTSGIVMPMSEEAWKESIYLELKMKKVAGMQSLCFVFGNDGESFAQKELGIAKEKIIKISNFVGFLLDCAVNLELKSVLLAGHMGKLVKVAAGNFHTHSKMSDARMETLCAYAALEGAKKETLEQIYTSVTTDAVQEILIRENLTGVNEKIVNQAELRCLQRVRQQLKTGCVLFGQSGKKLAQSRQAEKILKEIQEEQIEK